MSSLLIHWQTSAGFAITSREKVEELVSMSSSLPMREKIWSAIRNEAYSAGTNEPIWAMIWVSAICRRYVDLPLCKTHKHALQQLANRHTQHIKMHNQFFWHLFLRYICLYIHVIHEQAIITCTRGGTITGPLPPNGKTLLLCCFSTQKFPQLSMR